MKINIEVDCTPQEARQMLGLPDLDPVHEIYLDQMKGFMKKGVTPDMFETVVKNWVPSTESGINMVQQLMNAFAGGMSAGSSSKKK